MAMVYIQPELETDGSRFRVKSYLKKKEVSGTMNAVCPAVLNKTDTLERPVFWGNGGVIRQLVPGPMPALSGPDGVHQPVSISRSVSIWKSFIAVRVCVLAPLPVVAESVTRLESVHLASARMPPSNR